MNRIKLQNDVCEIRLIYDNKMICGAGWHGQYLNNHINFLTTKKRNLIKAWEALEQIFNNKTTMCEVASFLNTYKLCCRIH